MRFGLLGAGRLGSSLGLALLAAGARLTGFLTASPEGRERAAALLGTTSVSTIADLVAGRPSLYVVAVPDQALPEVAAELAACLPESTAGAAPPTVLHTSGATSVSVLSGCEAKGASTLVFHPLQTFSDPHSGAARFAGSAVAVTPGGVSLADAALDTGFMLAEALGARPFLLPDDQRALYHAAATIACNYLVTLEHCAESLFTRAGMPPDAALSMFLPLVRATIDNLERQGAVDALTGPLSRADYATIEAHLAALSERAPEFLPLYRLLGLHTLGLVRARGAIEPERLDPLAHLLNNVDRPGGSADAICQCT